MKADRRAQSARPQGMSLANSLREAKGGACPPFLRSYVTLFLFILGVSMAFVIQVSADLDCQKILNFFLCVLCALRLS